MSYPFEKTISYLPQTMRKLFIRETASAPAAEYPTARTIQMVARNFTTRLSPADLARFNGRLERGLELALNHYVTPEADLANCYQVRSAAGNGFYQVDLEKKTCQCPDSQKGNTCKHRIAAYYYSQAIKLQKEQEVQKEHAIPPQPAVKPTLPPASPNREAQILKEMGFEPQPNKVSEAAAPVHRLGSLYSRYLHGADLDGKAFQVTVREITLEKVMPHPSQPVEEKWCVWVSGLPEGLPIGILFGARGEKDLLAIFGRVDIGAIKGKQMVIYPVSTSVAGQNTVSIRFKSSL